MSDKPLSELNRKDVERLVAKTNTSEKKESTQRDYKIILKKYIQWVKGYDEDEKRYPDEVRWIRTTQKNRRLVPEALLSSDEIKRLIEAAENPRDRALVFVHFESGCMIEETLTMKICNVQSDDISTKLLVDGKTGQRPVRIVAAAPALAQWINIHPPRNDMNAPLWVSLGTISRYEPLLYPAMGAMLRRLVKKSGLGKRIYSHLLRHSRATELARSLTEHQLKTMFGWTASSNMTATYVSLSMKDTDEALLRTYGMCAHQKYVISE